MKLLHLVGARPNFMKIAPLLEALRAYPGIANRLVHSGQHYDDEMSGSFLRDLGLPEPDENLGVGSASHAVQTARVMESLEPLLLREDPDLLIVVGDVNSTLAGALTAAKLGIAVAHVEAGLRSGDRSMPEEINRLVTDRLSDLLFTPSADADENLRREGIDAGRIHRVGNIMIDTLQRNLSRARELRLPQSLGLTEGCYALATLHRPSNVDEADVLAGIFAALDDLAQTMPVLFPMHPRTARRAAEFDLALERVRVMTPLPYLEMLGLLDGAKIVLTDSGGIQEETTALGVPCLTLRNTTERPVTLSEGTNTLVPERTRERILDAVPAALSRTGRVPELWDGRTGERIAHILARLGGVA